jgi:hypothetical protein
MKPWPGSTPGVMKGTVQEASRSERRDEETMRGIGRWAVLATIVALSTNAHAGDDKDAREAKERFVEGIARARAGDWEGARRSFQQSVAVMPTQTAVFNLALAEEKCARPLEALTHFKDYVHRYTLSDDERAQARRHIGDLTDKTGHIEIQAPSGVILIVDGTTNGGTTPLLEPIDVLPGHHVIEAKLPRGPKSLTADVGAGQVVRIAFAADGEEKPLLATGVATSAVATASTAPDAVQSPPETPPESSDTGSNVSSGRVIVVAALGGTAVAAALLGLYFGQQSNTDANKLPALRVSNPTCPGSDGCQQLQDDASSAHSEHVTSDGLFVVSAVLAAASTAAWVFWPQRSGANAAPVRIVPSIGTAAVGAVAIGAF